MKERIGHVVEEFGDHNTLDEPSLCFCAYSTVLKLRF